MEPLSVIIITKNESRDLGDCLRSLGGLAAQTVVVDDHSTDGTPDLARAAGAEVFTRAWDGFGPQKQFALGKARHEWVLNVDADERLTPTAHEIGSIEKEEFEAFLRRRERVAKVKEYLSTAKATELEEEFLGELGLEAADNLAGKKLDYLVRRPDCDSEKLFGFIHRSVGEWADEREIQVALNDIRYAGYLKDQESLARKRGRYDELEIPDALDYAKVSGLSNEAVRTAMPCFSASDTDS